MNYRIKFQILNSYEVQYIEEIELEHKPIFKSGLYEIEPLEIIEHMAIIESEYMERKCELLNLRIEPKYWYWPKVEIFEKTNSDWKLLKTY